MTDELYDMRNENDRKALTELINFVGVSDLVMCEIGSYRGQSAEIFLNTGLVKKIYCIDPWENGYDDSDKASDTNMKLVESDFDNRVGKDNRVIKLKGKMTDFIDMLKDIDLVYLDACHQYEDVKNDIEIIMNQIKPRIAISGHDYGYSWKGVIQAVNERLGNPDKTFGDGSWIKMIK